MNDIFLKRSDNLHFLSLQLQDNHRCGFGLRQLSWKFSRAEISSMKKIMKFPVHFELCLLQSIQKFKWSFQNMEESMLSLSWIDVILSTAPALHRHYFVCIIQRYSLKTLTKWKPSNRKELLHKKSDSLRSLDGVRLFFACASRQCMVLARVWCFIVYIFCLEKPNDFWRIFDPFVRWNERQLTNRCKSNHLKKAVAVRLVNLLLV